MRTALYWLLTRSLVLAGGAALAVALAVPGGVRAAALTAAVLVTVVGVVVVRYVRRHLAAGDLEPLGKRRGFALSVADATVLLTLAGVLPTLDVAGRGDLFAHYPGPPVVNALALLTVAHVWWQVHRADDPLRLAAFLHPVLVMVVAVATWLLVDRALPDGRGVPQSLLAILLAAGSVAFVVAVHRIQDRFTRVPRNRGGVREIEPQSTR